MIRALLLLGGFAAGLVTVMFVVVTFSAGTALGSQVAMGEAENVTTLDEATELFPEAKEQAFQNMSEDMEEAELEREYQDLYLNVMEYHVDNAMAAGTFGVHIGYAHPRLGVVIGNFLPIAMLLVFAGAAYKQIKSLR